MSILSIVKGKKFLMYLTAAILLAAVLYFMFFYSPYKFRGEGPVKIMMVHSYYSKYPSVTESIAGFEDYFNEKGVDYEVKQYYLGEERNYSDENLKKEAEKAMAVIEEWDPDLLYTTDDYAPDYVSAHYFNTKLPIIFSGVNQNIEDHNFDKAKNVAGVTEREKLQKAIEELRNLIPYAKKVAVVSDSLKLWKTVMDRLKLTQEEVPDLEVVGWHTLTTFQEYKDLVKGYEGEVDALIICGVNTLKDEEGKSIPKGEAMKWDAFNSSIPTIGLASSYARWGGLLEISTYNYKQGREGAMAAYRILFDGELPREVGFTGIQKGNRVINLARAKTLNINIDDIPSTILINSEVVEKFPWEE